jgi:hypothetical protein
MLQHDSRFSLGLLIASAFRESDQAIHFETLASSDKGTFAETSKSIRAGLVGRAGSDDTQTSSSCLVGVFRHSFERVTA